MEVCVEAYRSYLVGAIDPGEAWCGVALLELVPSSQQRPGRPSYLDCSSRGQIRIQGAWTLQPSTLYRWLETHIPHLHHVVLENYRLYPWMAREQGYSELLTAQCVGVVRYIAARHEVPLTLQDAKGSLKEGRAIASRSGFDMVPRILGSGRFKYRGPDFKLPGRPHRRDACAHGVFWSARDPQSPLLLTRRQRAS